MVFCHHFSGPVQADAGGYVGNDVGGVGATPFHKVYGVADDVAYGAFPSCVYGCHDIADVVVKEHGDAVCGLDADAQARHVGDDGVGIGFAPWLCNPHGMGGVCLPGQCQREGVTTPPQPAQGLRDGVRGDNMAGILEGEVFVPAGSKGQDAGMELVDKHYFLISLTPPVDWWKVTLVVAFLSKRAELRSSVVPNWATGNVALVYWPVASYMVNVAGTGTLQ